MPSLREQLEAAPVGSVLIIMRTHYSGAVATYKFERLPDDRWRVDDYDQYHPTTANLPIHNIGCHFDVLATCRGEVHDAAE